MTSPEFRGFSSRGHVSSTGVGRVSSTGIGGGYGEADYGYDARRDAYEKFMKNPGQYTSARRIGDDSIGRGSTRNKGPVTVVIEHRSGCTGKSVCEDIRESIKYNFSDVRVQEIERGRFGSFEVFINGKILYSRIMQGGYPYEDEVLDAVDRARNGEEFEQLDRGSATCNIL